MIISESIDKLIILSLGALCFFACLCRRRCSVFGGCECNDKVDRARHFCRVHVVAAGTAVVGSDAGDGNKSVEALACGFLIGFNTAFGISARGGSSVYLNVQLCIKIMK